MSSALEFILNGETVRAADVSPNTTLLEFLRGRGLTGSKEGCAEGDCGACSVVIIERDANGKPTYRAVNSCLMPICLVAGREVVSVEGVGYSGKLHPVQRAMAEGFGSQCGYCTPGFVCSMLEGYYRDDLRTRDQLDDQLSGNLCRCTGYRPIRDAAVAAFAERSTGAGTDELAERLRKSDATIGAAGYEFGGEKFFRPASLVELFKLRAAHPEARLIAGATELGLDITKRFHKFPTLISVDAVAELKEFKRTEREWRIGAAVTLTEIEDRLAKEFPSLGDMLRVFGSRQIRNRATMGGNIVTASPIGDSAPVLLALDAEVVIVGPDLRERNLPVADFFVSYRKTALQAGEVLKSIIIPRQKATPGLTRNNSWHKVSKRREMDISTVAGCFTVDLDERRTVRHARLAFGGVAATPVCAKKTETALLGKVWDEETIRAVTPILRSEFTPISDVRGSAAYRSGLIVGLLEKFFAESVSLTPGFSPVCEAHGAETVSTVSGVRETAEAVGSFTQSLNTGLKPGVNENFGKSSIPHESAHKHVTGEAIYADDQTSGMLETWPVCSPHARAKILKRDATPARKMPGVKAVLLAEDIPGDNDSGTKHDEPLLAQNEVFYHSQIVAMVVGDSPEACRAAAEKVVVEYEPLAPITTLRDALAKKSFHNEPNYIRRGEVEKNLADAPLTLEGEFELGGQEHFYLESHAAHATRGEDGSLFAVSSTQHPSEVQQVISHVLHLPSNKVVVQVPRMGGGFGGKETQAAIPAALAALAAHQVARPVRVRFNRDQDMAITGHRHPFFARFKVGFAEDGTLRAAQVHLWSNGGWSLDLSQAVTDRALFHLDNAYYIPAVEFRGQVAKTNISSNTAFRGFGGPQGMLVIEEIMDRIARRLGLPPELVRERNLYHGNGETNTTHYGQEIEDNRIQLVWGELKKTSEFENRRAEIAKWNEAHPHVKRGLAITPVKFGISFTVTHLNQAGAFVLIYQDGTVQLNHGGTEMGQGLHTNVAMIAAQELGVKLENIRVMPTSTEKVPNTSATAASAGTDLNGAAVKNACEILRRRLEPIALAQLKGIIPKAGEPNLTRNSAPDAETTANQQGTKAKVREVRIWFSDGWIFDPLNPEVKVSFVDVVRKAYMERISLSTTGFYATPGIHWDRVAGRGKPFLYFANGAAVTEVEVDGFTGMQRVLRVDILHDVGDSVNEGVNRGQIEGGFIQGMGWLTAEELLWNEKGVLLTHSPDTYKIPSIGDTPHIFNVALLKNATQKDVIHGSKAVGEPPLMLAISVREAIRDAIAAFGAGKCEVPLASPATCEAIWMAIQKQRESSHRKSIANELVAAK